MGGNRSPNSRSLCHHLQLFPQKREVQFFDEDELRVYKMAYFQRRMYQMLGVVTVLGILASSLNTESPQFMAIPLAFIVIAAIIYLFYCFFRYQAGLIGWGGAFLACIICAVIPFLLLLRIVMSSYQASKKYKEYGLETDWLGVTNKELKRLKS
jgi:hypothetical protein